MTTELDSLSRDLGLALTVAQLQALAQYLALLQRWNATYNLTAVRDPQVMLTQHLADCLAVVPPFQKHLVRGRVLDVGSGGGLPGALLAIVEPAWRVTCVDTVGKKAAFIQQVAGTLGLPNLSAVHTRVESLAASPFDLITSRAFASLADFTRQTRTLLAPQGVWAAMKGKQPRDEIDALPSSVEVFHVEPLTVPGLSAERCLIWMRPADRL